MSRFIVKLDDKTHDQIEKRILTLAGTMAREDEAAKAAGHNPLMRSFKQRMADAFSDFMTSDLVAAAIATDTDTDTDTSKARTGTCSCSGSGSGSKPKSVRGRSGRGALIVTADIADQFSNRPNGICRLPTGEPLPLWVADAIACDGDIFTALRGANGQILDFARAHREIPTALYYALVTRDGGCVICHKAPQWCEAHHIIAWHHNGKTNLDNLVLLCKNHHTHLHQSHLTIHQKPNHQWQLKPP